MEIEHKSHLRNPPASDHPYLEDHSPFIDKSRFIEKLFFDSDAPGRVNKIPGVYMIRPRRTGKTAFINYMRSFFTPSERPKFTKFNQVISKNSEAMNSDYYPVIVLTLSGLNIVSVDAFLSVLKTRIKDAVLETIEGIARDEEIASSQEIESVIRLNVPIKEVLEEIKSVVNETDVLELLRVLMRYLEKITGKKIILLIDEFDSTATTLLFYRSEFGLEIHSCLQMFFRNLKPLPSARFVYITGATSFFSPETFSGLNTFLNLTFHSDFNEMFGFTWKEMTESPPYMALLQRAAEELYEGNLENLKAEMKDQYNGYMWNSESGATVFNALAVNCFLKLRYFRSYWEDTGSCEFLLKSFEFAEMIVNESSIKGSRMPLDLDQTHSVGFSRLHGSLKPLDFNKIYSTGFSRLDLRQMRTLAVGAGYLTVLSWDHQVPIHSPLMDYCTTRFPNQMTLKYLVELYAETQIDELKLQPKHFEFVVAQNQCTAIEFANFIDAMFKDMPYLAKERNVQEGNFQRILKLYLTLFCKFTTAEQHTASGRSDLVGYTDRVALIFELKKHSQNAKCNCATEVLSQIKSGHYDSYARFTGKSPFYFSLCFQNNVVHKLLLIADVDKSGNYSAKPKKDFDTCTENDWIQLIPAPM